ncbi:MAG: T9SS type A sorting domain-containing protein [Bacteroidales bacterium]|nr:T9SS type A sorting domain-containing protein [Bacteroidales bacterium]
MVKKVLALALGLMLAISSMAQWGNPTVSQNDIQFWTGTGSNRAVIAITWNDFTAGNIGVAWGVQWNGNNVVLRDLMDTIAAYDSRLIITWNSNHSYVNNLAYVDTTLGLDIAGDIDPDAGYAWFMYSWKDSNDVDKSSSSVGVTGDVIINGDFVDWLYMDYNTFESYPADTMIMATDPNAGPVDPQPEEATISAEQISYWVGEGNNKVVLAVNWADTALAWGYKFSTDSVTVQQVMDAIMAADHRFSWVAGGWGLGDILFALGGDDTLRGTSYWESKRNGLMDAGMSQMLGNGDFEKWADPAAGTVVDSSLWDGVWYYTYVYTMEIHPVSAPAGIAGIETVDVTVYPNPVATVLNVRCEVLGQNTEAAVYDMTGRKVYSREMAAGSSEVQIPVGQLADGAYMLRVGESAAKVVVRH